jgi:DNA-binding response OmpR family regulator
VGKSFLGERIGPYLVEESIGSGGMGQVFRVVVIRKVRDLVPGKRVALKVIHPALASSPGFVQRFLREAEIGSKVRSPYLVATLDAGIAEVDGQDLPYLVMDLADGESLLKVLQGVGRIPDELCRRVGREVADALAVLHSHGIVHRDLKLENVLATVNDHILLTDFGTARMQEDLVRLTRSGQFVGTCLYAAPEQFEGTESGIGPATDLYSLGWVLYCLVAGRHPLDGREFAAVAHFHLNEVPAPLAEAVPHVSPFLSAVVACLLEKDPSKRFPSAQRLSETLRAGEESEWWKALRAAPAAVRPSRAGSAAGKAPSAPTPAPPSGGVLEDIEEVDRDLLSLAACIGEVFDPVLAGAAYGLGAIEALKRFASMGDRFGVVRTTAGNYKFAAPALHQGILREVPPALHDEFRAALERARKASGEVAGGTMAGPPPPPPVPAAVAAGMETGPARVLVVDDDPMARGLLVEEVRMLGHEVSSCENGIEGLVELRRGGYDLLVTDVDMPGLSGLALLRRVKAEPLLRGIPVIVVSGGEGDLPVQCIREGAEDYLHKPYDFTLLQARVGACLDRRRLLRKEAEARASSESYSLALEEVLREAKKREDDVRKQVEDLSALLARLPAGSTDPVRKEITLRMDRLRRSLAPPASP